MARVNYLNNRDLMAEIHKSKCTYCYTVDDKYNMYDAIVYDLKDITSNLIKQTREEKASRLVKEQKHYNKMKQIKGEVVDAIDPESLPVEELVFRLMTWDHVPIDEIKKEKAEKKFAEGKIRVLGDDKIKPNFPSYQHWVIDEYSLNRLKNYKEVTFKEVGRSHWEGGLENGWFNKDHGKMTNKLCDMFMKLVNRYATRSNWRGYSYNEDMRGQALMQLAQVGLQFNEAKSSNPFSYYTETVTNSFTRVLNIEKNHQHIRDDILIQSGSSPSFTRQIEHEIAMKELEAKAGWAKKEPPKKRGRKSKADLAAAAANAAKP